MNSAELDARLEAANPVTVKRVRIAVRPSVVGRVGQVVLGALVAMSIGVGVTWAATGENPIQSVFSNDLDVSTSEVGFKSFSSLEPMNQELLDGLPPRVAQMAMFLTFKDTVTVDRSRGLPSLPKNSRAFEPDPAKLSAVARVKTNLGTPAILLVVNGEICSFSEANTLGTSGCSTFDDVREGRVINWRSEPGSPELQRVEGLFDDRVAAVDVLEDAAPPIWIPGQVLELRNVEKQSLTFVGLDSEGKELFRRIVSLNEQS